MPKTAAQTPSIAGVFRQPFAEQVVFFRNKMGNLIPTAKWTDVQKSGHDTGFMVAGAAKADLLADFAVAVERTISEGKSLDAFQKDFDHIVKKHGWVHTGGRDWRSRVIYQTNTSTAYAAGREAQIEAGGFAYKMYQHSDSVARPRPYHLSWNGLVLPVGDPFWQTHTAPNGWGCKCRIIGIRGEAAAKRLGGRWGDKPPDGWDKIDPKTGEQVGIDKGWGYSPGATVTNTVRQMAAKTQQWDYTLAKAYMQGVPDNVRDDLARAYRELPSVADDARRFAARALAGNPDAKPYLTLGLLTVADAAMVESLTKANVGLFDYSLDASSIRHVQDVHGDAKTEVMRGQRAVTAADYARLPELLNAPDSIEYGGISDVGHPIVRITKLIDGELVTVAFEIRGKRKMLALQSLWIKAGASSR